MTPFIYPGIGLDQAIIIKLINQEFDLPDTKWVTTPSRETHVRIARQLLMTCLIDHLSYSQSTAGAVCNRDHVTARHGKEVIFDTFWYDPQYGDKVKCVYNRCIELKKRILV